MTAISTLAAIGIDKDAVQGFLAVAAGLLTLILTIGIYGGLMLLCMAIMPNVTSRASIKIRTRQVLSLLVGLGVFVPSFILTAIGHLATVLGLAIFVPLALLGLLAASEALGRKLYLISGREASRPKQVIAGWPVLLLASATPIVGWFIVFPYALLTGMGAVVLGFFSKEDVL